MSSLAPITMLPEEVIFTFKQGSEESFKDAWARINESYDKTEPKMTLSLLLSSFDFGLVLHYRYALDTVEGGDFLHYDGDQAFNAIKNLIATYSSPTKFDFSLENIFARLNALEIDTAGLKEHYNQFRENHEDVPIVIEPSGWLPMVKVVINSETFHARCDIMSEFCLMPKDIYDSLNLWGLLMCEEKITLANNATISPIGVAEGVFTKILGRTVSTDYLVIECVGKGQITLGRSLLKLMGAKLYLGKGTMVFTSPPGGYHCFPMKKGKKKRRHGNRALTDVGVPPLGDN